MSLSNVSEAVIRNEFRAMRREIELMRGQLSVFIKNNSLSTYHSTLLGLDYASAGHTGFASSADLTAHTGDTSNPHLTTLQQAAAAGGEVGYIPAASSAPADGNLWWDTTSTPPWLRVKQPDAQWTYLLQAAP